MSIIGVITNPRARAVARDPMLPRRLAQIGGKSTLVVETRDLDEVPSAVREFADRGVQVIAACGGDGTSQALLTEMVRTYGDRLPRLAILRGGTVNTVANNLGIRGSPEDIFTRLVACRNRGMVEPTEKRAALSVNGAVGFLFGAAFASRFYEIYNRRSDRGAARAVLMAARVTSSALLGGAYARDLFRPVTARITADGNLLPGTSWTLLVASTLMDVGLGIRITYRALERPDCFHLVASGLSPFHLARQFHKTFMARPLAGPGHHDLLLGEMEVEFPEGPQPYILDGDLFQADRLEVRAGPAVRLSIP